MCLIKNIYFLLILSVLLKGYLFALNTDSFVNLRYLEKEIKTINEYKPEIDGITISKNGRTVKIFLNIPYIISDEHQKKIDIPPFTENGVIYISQYTLEQIIKILDTQTVKQNKIVNQETEINQEKIIKKKEIKEEKITKQEDRIIIEKTPEPEKTRVIIPAVETRPAKQKRIIVIDPGHGGTDPGAIGPNGVQEKDIVLDIALRVIKYLKNENFKIYFTRDDDNFISLKERAVFANNKNADLFVSIHCNASKNRGAQGIRTYIYNRVASSREAAEAAKLENKNAGFFEFLLNDLKKGAFEYLSIEAAGNIQHCLVKNLRLKWSPTERAPFYVLANTSMPSVLVETAFISNPNEERKLDDNDFREKIAKSISDGILEYFSKLK